MTNHNNSAVRAIDKTSLAKHLLLGGAIGLAVISFFIIGVDNPNPEWGEFWRIRPLIITPLSGATGGAFFYFLGHLAQQRGWSKTVAFIGAFVISFIGLWMGIVLGLAGTMWN